MIVKKQLFLPLQLQPGLMKDGNQSKMKRERDWVLFNYKIYVGPDPGTTGVIRNWLEQIFCIREK